MGLILEDKFADDPWDKFIFYKVIGQKPKLGCLNLTFDLLNRNLTS